jgi:AcrR family transcriptional regulator
MATSEPTIRPPQQPRSRASLERVIAAGTKLLEAEGYEGFTLAKVSSMANVSIGSIYARVKSKDDLFYVIQDRFMSRTEGQPEFTDEAAWAHLPPAEMVAVAIKQIGRVFQEDAPLLRVFMHRGLVDDVVGKRSSASVSHFSNAFEELLLTRRREIVHPDPELAVDVAFRMAWGTLARQIMYWPTFESHRAVAWDTMVEELGRACASYLFGTVPAAGDGPAKPRRARRGS